MDKKAVRHSKQTRFEVRRKSDGTVLSPDNPVSPDEKKGPKIKEPSCVRQEVKEGPKIGPGKAKTAISDKLKTIYCAVAALGGSDDGLSKVLIAN